MNILYHPDFAQDIRRYEAGYALISQRLADRFRHCVDSAIQAVKANPTAAGHFLNTGSTVLREVRRRNLPVFPFFVLYGLGENQLIFGSIIPSASDPLHWEERFRQNPLS